MMDLGLRGVRRIHVYEFTCGCQIDDPGYAQAAFLTDQDPHRNFFSLLGAPESFWISTKAGSCPVRVCAEHKAALLAALLPDRSYCERCVQPLFADDARRREIVERFDYDWFPQVGCAVET